MKFFNLHPFLASAVINVLLYTLYLFVPCKGAFCEQGIVMQPANLLNLSALQFGLFFNWNDPHYYSSFDNFVLYFPPTFGSFLLIWAIVLCPVWMHLIPEQKTVKVLKVQVKSKKAKRK